MSDPDASARRLKTTKRLLDHALNEVEREGRIGLRRVRGTARSGAEPVEDVAALAPAAAQ